MLHAATASPRLAASGLRARAHAPARSSHGPLRPRSVGRAARSFLGPLRPRSVGRAASGPLRRSGRGNARLGPAPSALYLTRAAQVKAFCRLLLIHVPFRHGCLVLTARKPGPPTTDLCPLLSLPTPRPRRASQAPQLWPSQAPPSRGRRPHLRQAFASPTPSPPCATVRRSPAPPAGRPPRAPRTTRTATAPRAGPCLPA